MNRIRRERFARRAFVFASLLFATLASTREGDADTFCTPPVQAIPNPDGGTSIVGPTVDGIVADDPGWLNAFRYVSANGTPSYDVAVQALKGPTDLFLSVEVPADSACSDTDGVVFAFDTKPGDTTNLADRFRRVSLKFPPGACSTGTTTTTPSAITYATGKADATIDVAWTLGTGALATGPTGTLGAFTGAVNAAPLTGAHWSFELKLPLAGFGLVAGTKMFWSVFTTAEPTNSLNEISWPLQCADSPGTTEGCIFAVSGTSQLPPAAKWGTLSLDSTGCAGVSIDSWGAISAGFPTVTSPTSWNISLLQANYFHAQVKNGGATTAQGVTASFRIANFGTSYAGWAPIDGVPGNPTASSAATDIDAGATADLTMGPWTLNADQQIQYRALGNPHSQGHQCVEVVLDSPTHPNVFTRSRAYTNMEVGSSTVFTETAEINTNGLPAPANGAAAHDILYRAVPVTQYAYGDGSYPGVAVGHVAAELHWYFRPYRLSGKMVDVFGKKEQLVYPGPAFGSDILHDMPEAFQAPFNARHAALLDKLTCHPPSIKAARAEINVGESGYATNDTQVLFQNTDDADAIVCWATGNNAAACGAASSGATGSGAAGCSEVLTHCTNGNNCGVSKRGPLLTTTNENVSTITCDAAGKKTPTPMTLKPTRLKVSQPWVSPSGGQVSVGTMVTLDAWTDFVTFVYTTDGSVPTCAGGGTSQKVNGKSTTNDGERVSEYQFALTGNERQINAIACRSSGVNGAPTPGDFEPSDVSTGQPFSWPVVIERGKVKPLAPKVVKAVAAAGKDAGAPAAGKDGGAPAAVVAKPVAPKKAKLVISAAAVAAADDGCYKAPDPRFYALVNRALANDAEKPLPNDFAQRVDGMKPTTPADPSLYSISVPPNSIVKVTTSAGYQEVPPPPPIICNCASTAGTAVFNIGALGGAISFAALYLARRRRRRHG